MVDINSVMVKGKYNQKAFTLLEILMTIIIMTVALIPMMQLMPQGMRVTRRLERLTQATFLAQEKAGSLRRTIFDSDYDFDNTDSSESATAFASPFASYKYTVTDNQAADIKNLNVTVWFDADNDNAVDDYSAAYREDEPFVSLDFRIANRS
ncbi:MAG: prepilin-type N-terminal cleavage/methylation domain-containing protein [Candidatus Omnitrophica bacterium]|nr:prepilin-type N-terminal cleavage/methylation domain-containing protein [Candidatus Omnitrophota bacterium]